MTQDQLAAEYDVYPRFRNDIAVSEICIGTKKFKCIGVSPPHDHPHVYIDMANQDEEEPLRCMTNRGALGKQFENFNPP